MKSLLLFFLSVTAFADGPILWGPNSSSKALQNQICFPNGSCINGSGGGGGITALTGDVTASGSGSVAATIANSAVTNAKIANGTIDLTSKVTGLLPNANLASIQYSLEWWVQTSNGSDVACPASPCGDGSFQRPWLTLKHACASLIPTTPNVIHMTGNVDTSASTITCQADTAIVADVPSGIEVFQPLTFTVANSGGGNEYAGLQNIITFGAVTWDRSADSSGASNLTLINSNANGGVVFKTSGAGVAGSLMFVYQGDVTSVDILAGQLSLTGTGLFGALTYEDSGSSFLLVSGTDIAGAISLNGGNSSWFTGSLADSGYSISGTTTGSGTPTIVGADSGSLPPAASITGMATPIGLTSLAVHESYTPKTPGNWASPVPSNVQDAIDRIAAVVGVSIPIP